MTAKEKQSRNMILAEIMSSMNVSKKKAESLLSELESFKLVKFDAKGNFFLRAIEERDHGTYYTRADSNRRTIY